jgi:diacylglycerol kinase family enzyme
MGNTFQDMEIALVANPASGSGTDAAELADALRGHGARVRLIGVEEAQHARVARSDRVVVAGGDGSVGCAAALAARGGCELAVVPTGTANDFARALELPDDLREAVLLAAGDGSEARTVDLLWAGDRPFVNVASAGLAPRAAATAAPLKPRLGALAYAVGALSAGLRERPIDVRARCGRSRFEGAAWQVTVGGTGAFGGGASLDEEADLANGELDVAVVEARSRLHLVRLAFAMRRGALLGEDDVTHLRGKTADVAVPGPWNIDGEIVDLGPEARFRIQPAAVRVVVRKLHPVAP